MREKVGKCRSPDEDENYAYGKADDQLGNVAHIDEPDHNAPLSDCFPDHLAFAAFAAAAFRAAGVMVTKRRRPPI
jgi:hypothetical protein